MKNIHVLPTDKPSRLYYNNNDQELQFCEVFRKSTPLKENQHIYITSDELPKLDEWGINTKNNVIYKDKGFTPTGYEEVYCRKIILTTDQDLIKDGVQAIDDEFLEWFVKNPSCEKVELEHIGYVNAYKTIIPKEEPKQELPGAGRQIFKIVLDEKWIPNKVSIIETDNNSVLNKQETLEEAAENYIKELDVQHYISQEDFVLGAKWQAERMYSFDELRLWLIERDVYLYNYYTTYKKSGIPVESVDKYIEESHEYLMGRKQFKKK